MPDLLAGSIITALDTPPTKSAVQNAAINTTSTSYEAGSTVCGTDFMAPTTGRVEIKISGELDSAGSAVTLLSVRVGTGSTVGAGTEILAASDDTAISNSGTDQVRTGAFLLNEGLTPGATYNVQTMHRTTSGAVQGTLRRRCVIVSPAT